MQGLLSLPRLSRNAVVVDTACWTWTGARQSAGYGSMGMNGKTVLVHRYAYEMLVGPIPEGMTVDHLCSNKVCFRPEHLQLLDRNANSRKHYAAITHCPQGHEYDVANTKLSKRGTRSCRTCYNLARVARRAMKDCE